MIAILCTAGWSIQWEAGAIWLRAGGVEQSDGLGDAPDNPPPPHLHSCSSYSSVGGVAVYHPTGGQVNHVIHIQAKGTGNEGKEDTFIWCFVVKYRIYFTCY